MKTIRVVAAVIREGDRIFATARGYGDYKGGWEFPGGKIETGETPQEALVREIEEELDTKIVVGELISCLSSLHGLLLVHHQGRQSDIEGSRGGKVADS